MKKYKSLITLLITLLITSCLSACSKTTDVVILYTNDINGNIDNFDLLSGYVAGLKADGENVLLIDGGDFFQGSIYGKLDDGDSIVKLMNIAQYDFVVPGNHEYDCGIEKFVEHVNNSNFKYLTCNIPNGYEYDHVTTYIATFDEYRIGFLGIEYELDVDKYADTVQSLVDDLREQNVDLVIGVGHIGDTLESLIKRTTGIDIFLNAHNQIIYDDGDSKLTYFDGENKPVSVYEDGSALDHVCRLDIKLSKNSYEHSTTIMDMEAITAELEKMDSQVVEATMNKANDVINDLKTMAGNMEEVIGTSEVYLHAYDPTNFPEYNDFIEYNSSDFVADAYRVVGNSDIGLVNTDGLRGGLEDGEIIRMDICSFVPWLEDIYVAEVTGQQIIDLLESKTYNWPEYNADQPGVSGMSFCIDAKKDSERVYNVRIEGEPLELDKIYTVSGPYYYLFTANKDVLNLDEAECTSIGIDYQVIEKYITDYLGGVIPASMYENPSGDGRIYLGY